MAEASFTNFFNNGFGLNVRPRTLEQLEKTAKNAAGGALEPLFTYLAENENVFSGDIMKKLNQGRVANFNIEMAMNIEDQKVNGSVTFDTQF